MNDWYAAGADIQSHGQLWAIVRTNNQQRQRREQSVIYQWDPQLSDHEVHFIGMIFIHWASLEHEVFMQTLNTFVTEEKELASASAAAQARSLRSHPALSS